MRGFEQGRSWPHVGSGSRGHRWGPWRWVGERHQPACQGGHVWRVCDWVSFPICAKGKDSTENHPTGGRPPSLFPLTPIRMPANAAAAG